MRGGLALAAVIAALATPAAAEVTASSPDGFSIRIERRTDAPAADAFALFAAPERWWSPLHTWSGDAASFRMEPHAGGCWCEALPNMGTVEHGHIIRWDPENGKVLMRAELGPLQALPVNGKLEWLAVTGPDGETRVAMRYEVTGRGMADPAALATAVDRVLSEQLDRLVATLAADRARNPAQRPT
jgi:hypothetical protein